MSFPFTSRIWAGGTAVLLTAALGCSQKVSNRDISDAREEVNEERQETEEVRVDGAAAIEEERRETEQVRQEVMKPVLEDDDAAEEIAEEREETNEAVQDSSEAVAEEERETAEAEAELGDLEARQKAQQSRDTFLATAQQTLQDSKTHVDRLQASADEAEGANKEVIENQIGELVLRQERVETALDKLEDEDVLRWDAHRAEAERALNDLQIALDDEK